MLLKNSVIKLISSAMIMLLCLASFNLSGIRRAEALNLPDVNDVNKLDKMLDQLDLVLDNLTADERNTLESIQQALNDTNRVKTTKDIITILDQNGLKAKLETVINGNITFEQAELTLKLIVPLSKGDWDGLKSQLKTIKQKYSAIIDKLKANGITEDLLYKLVIRVNTKLMESSSKGEITAANLETKLVQVVQDLVTGEKDFEPVKNVMIKAYNKLPVKILGDDPQQLFVTDNAEFIANLINKHIDESTNPEITVVKDTFELAKQIFADIYVPKSGGSGGGGGNGGNQWTGEFSTKLDKTKENQISIPGSGFKVTIPVGAFEIPENAEVIFKVTEIKGQEAEQLLDKLVDPGQKAAYKLFGKIYDLKIMITKNGENSKVTSFAKPLIIEFPYEEPTGDFDAEKLIMWRFNDGTGKVEPVGGKADKAKKVIRVSLGGFSKYGAMIFEKTFDDIKGHWAKSSIEILASRGVVNGIAPDRFEPEMSVTRAEFATLLSKALNLREEAPISFKDVPTGSWFNADIARTVKAGIVSGYGDGQFRPNERITREEMTVMIKKACLFGGRDLAGGQENVLVKYGDRNQVSDWAVSSLADVVNAGIMLGRADSRFAPKAAATRAEAATIIRQVINLL